MSFKTTAPSPAWRREHQLLAALVQGARFRDFRELGLQPRYVDHPVPWHVLARTA
jgi:hypothetical protein